MEQPNNSLEQQLRNAQSAVRDLFFANLLSGSVYETQEELQLAEQEADVHFPHPYFLVVIAKKEHWGTAYAQGQADQREYHFILRNSLENGLPPICQAANVRGEMTAILNFPEAPEEPLAALVSALSSVLEVLESEFDISVTVAVSRVYRSISALPKAYIDAQRVLEYQQLMGADAPVTTYSQLRHPYITPPSDSYFSSVQTLIRCVQSRDFSGLQIALHGLAESEFDLSRPTVDTYRFRIYGVVNLLLYLMDDLRSVVGNDIIDALNVGPRLTEAGSVSRLLEEMDSILDRLVQLTQTQSDQAAPSWVPQMRQYIHENYRNPDVTVASVADHFHMTPTYCSKVYREVYGVRILEEIQKLRLEEAKRLLQGPGSIRTIAERSGFPSTLTMSRAFKRYESTLPSSFRETRGTFPPEAHPVVHPAP